MKNSHYNSPTAIYNNLLIYLHKGIVDLHVIVFRIKGKAEDVTISHISKFTVDEASVRDLGNWRFRLDLNITFPYLFGNGKYKVDGLIGESFQIFGDGPFW